MTTRSIDTRSCIRSRVRLSILSSSKMEAHLLGDALQRANFAVVHCGSNALEFSQTDQADVGLLLADSDEHALQACAVARGLRDKCIKAVLVFETPRREVVVEAFKAGVRGIFSKTTSLSELQKCILAVSEGQIWASNTDVNWLLEALSHPQSTRLVDAHGADLLSKREQEVVRCVSEGQTNRLIAQTLGLSENTVKNYLFRIFEKLGISSRVELLLYSLSNAGGNSNGLGVSHSANEDEVLLQQCQAVAERLVTPILSLGEFYRTGRGGTRDLVTAYRWFLIAQKVAALSQERSCAAVSELEGELSLEQRAEAAREADIWFDERVRSSAKIQSDKDQQQQAA